MIGVYKITNTVDGKVYIGSTTTDVEARWARHKSALKAGKHYNCHLQNAWNKYGEGAFVFEFIESGENKDEIRRKELSWIARFFGKSCYNATTQVAGRPADPNKKPKLPAEERHKIIKLEDQLIRNWVKRIYGVRVPQYDLWNLTPEQAVKRLKTISPSLTEITKEDIEKAARRN